MNTEFKGLSLVLITPARNEEAYIEGTIQSVLSQTILPRKWVIVSDGSTDRTDEIVNHYAAGNPWIELVRMPDHRDRHFGAKVEGFNAGYKRVNGIQYEIVGSLDADISFEKDYIEYLLGKFSEMPELGVAGTPFVETTGEVYNYSFTNIEHVSGACQLFRRKCFEDIGGYIPIKGGGIDWVAVTTARMKGWKTRTFTERTCFHHRRMGRGSHSTFMTFFRHGQKDYFLGGHPVWEICRSLYQMTRRPYIVGGGSLFLGYLWDCVRQIDRPISLELLTFHRKEQMDRLRSMLIKILKLNYMVQILGNDQKK